MTAPTNYQDAMRERDALLYWRRAVPGLWNKQDRRRLGEINAFIRPRRDAETHTQRCVSRVAGRIVRIEALNGVSNKRGWWSWEFGGELCGLLFDAVELCLSLEEERRLGIR